MTSIRLARLLQVFEVLIFHLIEFRIFFGICVGERETMYFLIFKIAQA